MVAALPVLGVPWDFTEPTTAFQVPFRCSGALVLLLFHVPSPLGVLTPFCPLPELVLKQP